MRIEMNFGRGLRERKEFLWLETEDLVLVKGRKLLTSIPEESISTFKVKGPPSNIEGTPPSVSIELFGHAPAIVLTGADAVIAFLKWWYPPETAEEALKGLGF